MTDAVNYAGWAYKQGSKIKSWKKRFFVLRGRELSYYGSQNINGRGEDEKGRVIVLGVDGSQIDGKGRDAMLLITCERKSSALKFKPLVPEEARVWQRKLESAIQADTIQDRDTSPSSRAPPSAAPSMESVRAYYNTPTATSPPKSSSNRGPHWSLAESSIEIDHDSDDNQYDDDRSDALLCGRAPLRGPLTKARSPPSVVRDGWVNVGDPQDKMSWKRRYAVLTVSNFTYFASKGSGQALETVQIASVALSSARSNALDLVLDSGRVLGLAVDTREDLMAWEHAVASVLGAPTLLRAASSRGDISLDDGFDEPAYLARRPSSYAGVFCEGWLLVKQGFGRNDWARRYFVLNGATLQEHDAPSSQSTDEGFVVHMTVKNDASVPEFELELMSGRSLLLRAENTVDAERWIHALSDLVGTPAVQTSKPQQEAPVAVSVSTSTTLSPAKAGVKKTGWLLKEGQMIKSWKRRYFVLDGDRLQYFDSINSQPPLGTGIIFRVVRNVSPACSLDVHFLNGRILRLSAKSKQDIDDWFSALQTASELSARRGQSSDGPLTGVDAVDKNLQRGWLLKRGQMVKTWKKRYFTLQRNRLTYYDAVGGDLLGAGVVFDVAVGDQRPFCLDVRFQNGRLLHVVASDEDDFKTWHSALTMASEISESFLSQKSLSQDEAVFEKEFDYDVQDEETGVEGDNNTFSDLYDDENDGREDDKNGFGMWEAAMNQTPELNRESSWESDQSESIHDETEGYGSDGQTLLSQHKSRRGSDASSMTEETRGCSGWLRIEGGAVKNWKRRYFTLHGITLKYFKSASGSLLRSCEIVQVEEITSVKFGFAITLANIRRLVVAAESSAEYEKWLLAIWGVLADHRATVATGNGSLPGVINIKNVPSSPVAVPLPLKSHSGWLEKEGQRFKTWKKRYFTLKNGAIMYFNDVGGVAQGHGTVVGVAYDRTKTNTLRISLGKDRVMRVSAATPAEMNTWYQALSSQKASTRNSPRGAEAGDADFSEVGSNASSNTNNTGQQSTTRSAPSSPTASGAKQQQEARTRFDAGDYFSNDTITNESFLRIRGGDAELSLTNGSFNKPRAFKGDLSPTLLPPGQVPIEAQLIPLESDEDLEYLRGTPHANMRETLRKKKEQEDHVLILPDSCAACCVVM